MSFLMVFKGELVTDLGWGLLCVILGSGQGTPFPPSSTLSSFCLRLGQGRCPNVPHGAGTGIHTENPGHVSQQGRSCQCAVILSWSISCTPSPAWHPLTTLQPHQTAGPSPSNLASYGSTLNHPAFSGSDWKLFFFQLNYHGPRW